MIEMDDEELREAMWRALDRMAARVKELESRCQELADEKDMLEKRLTAMAWLEKQYKKTLRDIQHALARHCTMEEHDNLQDKERMLEWLMSEIKEGRT